MRHGVDGGQLELGVIVRDLDTFFADAGMVRRAALRTDRGRLAAETKPQNFMLHSRTS